mgnify:CR=1 FL=1
MPSENTIRPYKILGLSDSPLLTTGYSTISKTLFNYLSAKPHWDCYMIGNMLNTQPLLPPIKFDDGTQLDFKILGCGREMYAKDIMEEKIKEIKANIFWILHDTFFYYPWLLQKNFAPAKSVFYFPSDGGICMPSVNGKMSCAQILEKVDLPVAMSRFGQKQVKDIYGIKTEYIPHAVHTDVFYPMPKERREKMKEDVILFNTDGVAVKGALKGKFVIGSVFRNQPRKMTDRMIKALGILLRKYKFEDFVLLAHTDPKDVAAALDICELAQICGVKHKIFFTGMNFFKGFSVAQLNEVYNLFDVFFLSCFHPDTEITTNEGFKKIKDIIIGDEVLTNDGTFQKVEDKIDYEYNKEILTISTSYNPDVKITPNHYVYGIKRKKLSDYQKKKMKKNPKIELKPIEEFKVGDYLIIPKIKKIISKEFIIFDGSYISNQFGEKYCAHPRAKPLLPISIDDDFMWLSGIYLAEGCLSQKKGKPEGIVFCINTKEKNITDKILKIMKEKFDLNGRIKDDTRNRRTIWFNSASMGRKFKELFNSGAHNKNIPEWMLYLPKEKQQFLINGYLDGDGHYDEKHNSFEAVTVSSNLAHHLRLILIRLGYLISYKVSQRQSLNYRLRFSIKGKNSIGWMDDNNFYIRINKIKKEQYNGLVYDLSVANNHNYCNYWLGKNTSGEGFGIPTLEAASCGIPSVVTDFSSTPELLIENGKCGEPVKLVGTEVYDLHDLMFTKNIPMREIDLQLLNGTITGSWMVERGLMDCDDAAQKLLKLATNPALREQYGRVGREKAVRHYEWRDIGEKWDVLLKKLVEQ